MRQVPAYIIIGSGRMATHFCHYLNLLKISFEQFHHTEINFNKINNFTGPVLLLIKDSAIEDFIAQNNFLKNKKLIHFSGSLVSPFAVGIHPLMTFGKELYSQDIYQQIPFILEQGSVSLSELLPGLNNSYFYISKDLKAYYHALCVLSGNFTVLLWQKFFAELENKFNLPKEVAHNYLKQTFQNLTNAHSEILTGPLIREDTKTIQANLAALEGEQDPFQKIYQAFVEVYSKS